MNAMKNKLRVIPISLFLIFLTCPVYSQEQNKTAQSADKSVKGNLTVEGNLGVGTDKPAQKVEVVGYIKSTEGLCIGDACKKNWPSLKCADFDNRPGEETGDMFCASNNKACFGVSIGSGASYFNECSTPPHAVHKTRCCWVE